MITCQICQTTNHHLAVICSSCGGFLQGRIENLDLFSTMWKLIESPAKAFRTIAIARHKNYSIFLSSVAGIAFTFFVFWLTSIGDHSETLINLLAAGFTVGPFFGIFVLLLFSVIMLAVMKIGGMRVQFRNIYATAAYVCIPVIFSFVLIFPIEIMTFGLFMFTKNPSPYLLKPVSYILFLGLDGAFAVWSLAMLLVGVKSLLDVPWFTAVRLILFSLVLFAGVSAGGYYLFLSRLAGS